MRRIFVFAGLALLVLSTAAQATDAVKNWAAPSSWTPPSAKAAGRAALTTYPPLPFVPIAPCRLVDTRASQPFTSFWGPPALLGFPNERSFPIAGQCGIPVGAQAVSFNFTVVNPAQGGNLGVFPAGGSATVSTLNWPAGTHAIANAAVVPLGAILGQDDGITVHPSVGALDLVVDVNGFYGPAPVDPNKMFSLRAESLSWTMEVINTSLSCLGQCGLYATVSSGFGIYGENISIDPSDVGVGVFGFAQTNLGVMGVTSGGPNDVAGVLGRDHVVAALDPPIATGLAKAGVRGEGVNGVIGISNTSGGFGVLGVAVFPSTIAVQATGNLAATGAITGASKSFVQPHPLDASREINYISLEGPAAEIYFRGSVDVPRGTTRIEIPEHFRLVSRPGSYSAIVSPVGRLASVAVIEEGEDGIVVEASRDVRINYVVYAEREAFKGHAPVTANLHFVPDSEKGLLGMPDSYRQILISNGTLNPDGTTNLQTAERVGWAQKWRDDEVKAKAAQQAAAARAH